MLLSKPDFYDQTHKRIAAQGSRVIALAYKWIPDGSQQQVKTMARDEAESGLTFAGFLAFHCPVKPDSKGSVELLLQSSHRVGARTALATVRLHRAHAQMGAVLCGGLRGGGHRGQVIMITGDNALTACHVAREVSIVRRDVIILDGPGDESHPTVFAGTSQAGLLVPERRGALTTRGAALQGAVRSGMAALRWNTVEDTDPKAVSSDRRTFEQVLFTKDACFTGRALMAVATRTHRPLTLPVSARRRRVPG